jgi:UDP-3-O-[3-hydroxymyristoyl] glucosamine N-acyltransferase
MMGGGCITLDVFMRALNLSEIAELLGGTLVGDQDPVIEGVASIEDAGPGDLTFVAKPKFLGKLVGCRASAVIIGPGMTTDLPALMVEQPFPAFAEFLKRFQTDLDRVFPPGVHPTAVIDPEAEVAAASSIGPFCVVGPGTVIGAGSRLGSHVALGPDIVIGRDCLIYPQVTVRDGTILGDRVILHAGCSIGTDGFGYLPTATGPGKVPQVGIVVLEDDVEIGAGSCVDRSTTGRTVIGAGTKLDNQVQVAHNVTIGRGCAISAQSGISGSSVLEDGVTVGGKVGVGDHLRLGRGSKIAGGSGVIRDVPAGGTVFGYPALEFQEGFRLVAALRKLPGLLRRVAKLEKERRETEPREEK